MRACLFLGLLAACGTPPSAPTAAPADPRHAFTTAPYVPGGESSDDPAETQGVEALLATLRPALERCAAMPDAAAPPADPAAAAAQIASACAEAGGAHDNAVAPLGGRSRATDTLIADLARLADDLDYLRRATEAGGTEPLNALKHVRDAVAATRDSAQRWPTQNHDTYAGSATAAARADSWERMVDNDIGAARELRPMLDHLCFNQGLKDPRQIRARMLTAVSRPAAAEREARARALPSMDLPPEERAQREAWLAAHRALFSTYDDLVDQFRGGKITTIELKHEQERRIDDALSAFDAAATGWRTAHPR